MDTKKRSPIDRLLFATFLKGRTSSRDVWEEKGDMTPEDNQKIIEETNEIINDDSTYPFISYLSDLLAKSKPSDEAVIKLHDCIEKVAVTLRPTRSSTMIPPIPSSATCPTCLQNPNPPMRRS